MNVCLRHDVYRNLNYSVCKGLSVLHRRLAYHQTGACLRLPDDEYCGIKLTHNKPRMLLTLLVNVLFDPQG